MILVLSRAATEDDSQRVQAIVQEVWSEALSRSASTLMAAVTTDGSVANCPEHGTEWRSLVALHEQRFKDKSKGAPRSEQPDMNGSAPNVHRWSASYPAGVAQTVNTAALVSLKELVEEAFRSEAKVALIQMGRRFTFAELDRYSLQFAAWLQSEGVRKGDRVAIMLPNVLQYGVVLCAAFRVGAVVVNINPLFTAREVQLQLEDSGRRCWWP